MKTAKLKFRFYLLIATIFIMNPVLSQWTDITSSFGGGISASTNMGRPIVCDINNDNYPDLLVNVLTNPVSPYYKYWRLLKNNGNNTFSDVTVSSGFATNMYLSTSFIDFDGDGFKDMFQWNSTELKIYKNNSGTSFSDVSSLLGLTNNFFVEGEITSSLNVFDYDSDGDEDILYTRAVSGAITLTAIVNNQSTFSTKINLITNIPGNVAQGVDFSFADLDNDGDFDVLFDANISGQYNNGVTSLYLKVTNGYSSATTGSGLTNSLPAALEIFDINQDGNLDIIKGGSDCCSGPLYRVFVGIGNGTFIDQTTNYNVGSSWYKGNATQADIDNDTDFDFSWSYNYGNGASCRVLANNNNLPTYVDVTNSLGLSYPNTSFDYAQWGVWCDLDNDGDLDVINNNEGWGAVTSGNVWVKLNPTQGNYINIKLRGCGVNKSGIGARVKIDVGTKTRWLYYEKSTAGGGGRFDDVFHFGLGNASSINSITVFWPNNTTTVLNNVPGNQNLVISNDVGVTANITPAGSTTFCQGGSVVLNANTGTGLSYQWFNNALAISGATSASYTANASGSYTVVVTNASTCSATSTATAVTVNALPTATITPATATTFCQGGSVVLNANTGTGHSYQWYNNASAISGATSASYTANASGSYTVVVTNASACSSTSAATVVTVSALPTATITPATATTFCQGGSVVLNANTGTGLSYQWYNNASAISGATSSSYTANASGSYTVMVTNTSSCSATSASVNVLVNSNTTYFADTDNDGYGNSANPLSTCVQPSGYVLNSLDCNDAIAAINPAASEVCNSIDDNCNSQTDEGLTFTLYYSDTDNDGFGAGTSTALCSNPGAGYSNNALDCNNSNSSINPSATELCNSADDNCNSQIDEGLLFQNYYQDFDGDGFGAGSASSLCASQAGYVNNAFDCNDFQAQINPVAQETCNGIDDNCNTLVDDGLQFSNYFLDGDLDGFGSGSPQSLCNNPGNGYSIVNTDCNDAIAAINPTATEICNSIDDNCNLQIDEGLVFTNYFADNDGDGFGSPAQAFPSCVALNGMVTNNGDCNDANANINPGAEDIGGNGIDENCDGQIDNSIFELNATINLYPNPTRSELNIQVNSSIIGSDLYIFDAVGNQIHKQQILSTNTSLSVETFANGNYIVRIGEVVQRFVVQK